MRNVRSLKPKDYESQPQNTNGEIVISAFRKEGMLTAVSVLKDNRRVKISPVPP
jgi:hypothetical protein